MLSATCHCGTVRIEVARKPRKLAECNCSICRRYGAVWAYYTRKSVRISCPPDAISAYLWGDRSIEFYHCKKCGCITHYESVKKTSDSRIAVNARNMRPEDIASIRVRMFDGASTWKYLDE